MAKKKKDDGLTATERAQMLSAELAPYPCFNCNYFNGKCGYMTCWKYRVWFRVKWKEVTETLKRKR